MGAPAAGHSQPLRRLLRRRPARTTLIHRARWPMRASTSRTRSNRSLRSRVRPSAPSRRTERIAWAIALVSSGIVALTLDIGSRQPASPCAARSDSTSTHPTSRIRPADPLRHLPRWSADSLRRRCDGELYNSVWLRDIDSVVARPLPGQRGRRVSILVSGRTVARVLCGWFAEAAGSRRRPGPHLSQGYRWRRRDLEPGGVILFVRNPASAIYRVSADGGSAVETTRLDAGHVGRRPPPLFPDGQHFLYYVTAGPDARGIHIGQLDGSASRRLVDADGGGVYTEAMCCSFDRAPCWRSHSMPTVSR